MAEILTIAADPGLHDVLQRVLPPNGHVLRAATTPREGIRQSNEAKPDLVIIDLALQSAAGVDICRVLRAGKSTRETPLFVVAADRSRGDALMCLEIGADDFLVKPFSQRELGLRVAAVLRRATGRQRRGGELSHGPLRLDREAHRVWVGGDEVTLTITQFRLLVYLWERAGMPQSRDVLLRDVWQVDLTQTGRTVDTHVKVLRSKLGIAGGYVHTVRGLGYAFMP